MENRVDINDEEEVLHIVMFPWLAMGHLIPFLHLSTNLATKGHRISFISTAGNLRRLPQIPPHLSPLITFVPLPFPSIPNLPPNAESSMDAPHHQAQLLKIAFDFLKQPLSDFLEKISPNPDWIIYDYASHWLPGLAAEKGVSCAFFSLYNAATMVFFGPPADVLSGDCVRSSAEDFTVVPKWVKMESEIVYRVHELTKYMEGSEGNQSDLERFAISIDGSDVVLFRTCVEFEPEWFKLICELYNKPVVPVGFLPPSMVTTKSEDDDKKWIEIKGWLDKHSLNSVVYVALGTEATLSQDELVGLAIGLEQSGLPFFWFHHTAQSKEAQ
ncbi:UDP-glycosyltransferase 91C1 [Camellia lanceoleosa]|nr:UDP-glycosyltransferase 91C1 [Camellia lanceoleosa]